MFCKKCGKEMSDGTKFCPACGANQEGSESSGGSNQSAGQANIDLNQTINNFAEKNTDKLSEGEYVIVKAKWNIVTFVILWVVYMLALLISWGTQSRYSSSKPLLAIALVISLIVCFISIWLFLARRELVITNKKVYGRIGLIGTKSAVIPLNKIHYIAIRYTIIGRLIKSGTFLVYPGTIFGVGFGFISNAEELKDAIENELYKN